MPALDALPIVIMMPIPGALDSPTLDSPYQGRHIEETLSPAGSNSTFGFNRPGIAHLGRSDEQFGK